MLAADILNPDTRVLLHLLHAQGPRAVAENCCFGDFAEGQCFRCSGLFEVHGSSIWFRFVFAMGCPRVEGCFGSCLLRFNIFHVLDVMDGN